MLIPYAGGYENCSTSSSITSAHQGFFLAGNNPSETAEVESKLEEHFCPLLDEEFAAP
jgi:hypothetical protein